MQELHPENSLTVGMVMRGNAATEYEAGLEWQKIERGTKYCLRAIGAVFLSIIVLVTGYFLGIQRFFAFFLLLSLGAANLLHALGLFYLRHSDALYGKYRLLNTAWVMFTLSLVLHIALIAYILFQENPQKSVPEEIAVMSGILSIIAHGSLLLGLLQNKPAALDTKYFLYVWIALLCMCFFYGTLTLLTGLSLNPALREAMLHMTEKRLLTIVIGSLFLAVGLVGIIAYTCALNLLKNWANIARLMFGNLSPYDL
jgi:hypothetical protein